MAEEASLGTVAVLRHYPVKSMLGEDLPSCDVTLRGLAGDRVMALVHRETGKVASAKNPRLWRRLLKLHAALSGQAVKIMFPGGTVMVGTGPDIDAALSEFLEHPVTLAAAPPPGAALDRADPEEVLRNGIRAQVRVETGQLGGASPAGTFFDFAPLHLLTTSAVDRIAALSPRGTVELERYRPNIVIRTSAPGFAENDWAGRDLRIGPCLLIRVIARTPRCAIPTLEHGALPRDPDALRVPATSNRIRPIDALGPQPCAGVYAQVLRPGRIQLGHTARLALARRVYRPPSGGALPRRIQNSGHAPHSSCVPTRWPTGGLIVTTHGAPRVRPSGAARRRAGRFRFSGTLRQSPCAGSG